MMTADFVQQDSIVRRIWGNGDMVLMIFAGSAAEFALNRAVDWLFFTGELPRDPIGRLFATAGHSQHIVFADAATAARTLERIRMVHEAVERERGERIPDWAHRDVLYMLIDYSERAHELLARPLRADEQHELYDVFRRVGTGLGIPDLPRTYAEWRVDRARHLQRDLVNGTGTRELYARYRTHLGAWRYRMLLCLQALLVPAHVRALLQLRPASWARPLARLYPAMVRAGLRPLIQRMLMPHAHLDDVRRLDNAAAQRPSHTARPTRHFAGIGRRLARTAFLVTALALGVTQDVAAQVRMPADWTAFLGIGASRISTTELHERLAAGGYPAFDRTSVGFNLGVHATLRSGIMLGGEWHFLPVGGDTYQGRDMGLGAGYGTLAIGRAYDVSPRLRVYPRVGIGGGGFGLWIETETETDTVAFDDVLADPDLKPDPDRGGFLTLSRDNMVVDLGAGAELATGGQGRGPLIGVRLGYILTPFTTDWHVRGRLLGDGPEATVAGPYVRLMLGVARRR
jgi:uncharacterized protein (DUF2236 family)